MKAPAQPPGPEMFDAIFLDLDGTLSDPREGITRSIAYALEKLGIAAPPLDELVFAIGPPLRPSLARLIGSDDPAAVEAAVAAYRERFGAIGLFENSVYEGVPETLERLRGAGKTLYLATSKPRVYAERIVEHFGLARHFTALYGCELDGRMERKDEIVGHILATHGIAPQRAVMVGDRSHDVAGASAHAVAAIGAAWGYGGREELHNAGARWICERPADILAVLGI